MSCFLQPNEISTKTTDHCKRYVLRKKRFCRMTVKSGFEYCGEHQPNIEVTDIDVVPDARRRIMCPLDNKQ